jgi:hypothetical protein
MSEQLDLFDAVLGGEQSVQPSAVRQFAVTRRKLASEHGVSQFASSPTPSIWRGGDGELTPLPPVGIKPTQFADSEHHAEAVDLDSELANALAKCDSHRVRPAAPGRTGPRWSRRQGRTA